MAKALQMAGVEIIECHQEFWGDSRTRAQEARSLFAAVSKVAQLLLVWFLLFWKYLFRTPAHDLILVGYPGHLDVFLAKILGLIRSKPVIFDVFLSLYEAIVEDRKLVEPKSVKAQFLKLLDRWSTRAADIVLFDTEAHVKYYHTTLGGAPKKHLRVFVGAEEDVFLPAKQSTEINDGEVLFFGTFLPLHGVEVIVRAAAILKEMKHIHFTIIGNGPEWERCELLGHELGARVRWHPAWMDYHELSSHIARSEICLGIFSDSGKASRVIPCKVFNILAMGKPLITANTPAAQEIFSHLGNAYLVPPGNAQALADAIITVHNDRNLRHEIATAGLKLFQENLSRSAIGSKLVSEISQMLRTR
jgi:glycosyltransferase involved in cell wall biosynthesis